MIMPMIDKAHVEINKSWLEALAKYFNKQEFIDLLAKVRKDYLDKNTTIYPPPADIFKAFNETPLNKVKVVILGQDPYHNPGQAHGLCFSVPEGVQTPPSLMNIFKEIEGDIHSNQEHRSKASVQSTNLTRWATQGVFLLNTVLTVLKNQPASHGKIGWQEFTDHVIQTISDKQEHVVFILWGAYARSKAPLIDFEKHLILEAPHPSPLSAHRGFFGCKHFSQTNEYLKGCGKELISW